MVELLPRLIQLSMVKFCNCRLVGLPIITPEPVPSSRKACPIKPGPKVVLPVSVPLLLPTGSVASPSAGHQLASPCGGVIQAGRAFTVKTALELSVVPIGLDTLTAYVPACAPWRLVRPR